MEFLMGLYTMRLLAARAEVPSWNKVEMYQRDP
jgi:hypothetical protein